MQHIKAALSQVMPAQSKGQRPSQQTPNLALLKATYEHEAKRAQQTCFPDSIALYDENKAMCLSQSLVKCAYRGLWRRFNRW